MTRWGEARDWLADLLANPPDTDDCIVWPYSLDNNGYGQINWQSTINKVPRIVLTELVGPPPPGNRIEAAHAPLVCHERACVNPRHLRWATCAENNADKLLDDTHHRGQRHGSAKLTDADALAIYEADGQHTDIAAAYNVSRQSVSNIKNGHTWTWLTGHRRVA